MAKGKCLLLAFLLIVDGESGLKVEFSGTGIYNKANQFK